MAGTASADTLREALVSTYQSNPTLMAQREALRATDASVAWVMLARLRNEFMMPHTVPNRPMNGAALPAVTFQVQMADFPDFRESKPVYIGSDTQTFLSGLHDSTHYFRVRARDAQHQWGPWSVPLGVDVRHHSLALSLTLFGLGAVVFGLTVGFLVSDHSRSPIRRTSGEKSYEL